MQNGIQSPATILITRPSRANDPSQYTYLWGEKAIQFGRSLGYNVIDIKNEKTTHDNVSKMFEKYRPRLYVHFGHGCPASLQGRDECIINEKVDIEKLIDNVKEDSSKCDVLCNMMLPVKPLHLNQHSVDNKKCACSMKEDFDPGSCYPLCLKDTNTHLLRNTITLSVACHSASWLGIHAVEQGAETYIGFDDLLMFPVDTMKSQEMFGDVILSMYKALLLGATVKEAGEKISTLEDSYITKYKKIKYIALPMLWNKLHRKIIGNEYNTIY